MVGRIRNDRLVVITSRNDKRITKKSKYESQASYLTLLQARNERG